MATAEAAADAMPVPKPPIIIPGIPPYKYGKYRFDRLCCPVEASCCSVASSVPVDVSVGASSQCRPHVS